MNNVPNKKTHQTGNKRFKNETVTTIHKLNKIIISYPVDLSFAEKSCLVGLGRC